VPRIFHWVHTDEPRACGGVVLGEGQQPFSPPARVWESAVNSPAGFGVELRPPEGFLLFSALSMASPGTMILLLWTIMQPLGEDPVPPLCTPLYYVKTIKSVIGACVTCL